MVDHSARGHDPERDPVIAPGAVHALRLPAWASLGNVHHWIRGGACR
jgi:hypothetical protein